MTRWGVTSTGDSLLVIYPSYSFCHCCDCTDLCHALFSFSQPTEVLCVCPMKYSCLPVLTFFPVRKFLNVYQLAERTYEEDKATFQGVHIDLFP